MAIKICIDKLEVENFEINKVWNTKVQVKQGKTKKDN